jgi:hypothetical protein
MPARRLFERGRPFDADMGAEAFAALSMRSRPGMGIPCEENGRPERRTAKVNSGNAFS